MKPNWWRPGRPSSNEYWFQPTRFGTQWGRDYWENVGSESAVLVQIRRRFMVRLGLRDPWAVFYNSRFVD